MQTMIKMIKNTVVTDLVNADGLYIWNGLFNTKIKKIINIWKHNHNTRDPDEDGITHRTELVLNSNFFQIIHFSVALFNPSCYLNLKDFPFISSMENSNHQSY